MRDGGDLKFAERTHFAVVMRHDTQVVPYCAGPW